MIDSFLDSLHARRRRVPMTSQKLPRVGYHSFEHIISALLSAVSRSDDLSRLIDLMIYRSVTSAHEAQKLTYEIAMQIAKVDR